MPDDRVTCTACGNLQRGYCLMPVLAGLRAHYGKAEIGRAMIEWWDYYLGGYEAPQSGNGTATTLPVEPERDYGAELRAVVAEVTGRPCEAPTKTRMGFL